MRDWEHSPECDEWMADPNKDQKTLDESIDNYAIKCARSILQEGDMLILILQDAKTQETIWIDYFGRNSPDLPHLKINDKSESSHA